ncbi:helix-hairpin-helix domain-containing protein [Prevotella sp. E2-28]|uniref:helix-hairpin-helix domain-containing protein n=1 Tax=Prevotella sp. E2-28 TaxID=2913620 RepID=UPI001EDC6522|nr:helix-hairpin-helix domain-containing protein [Prevotella sp. E2-28]UKK53907.1 helix-hairpin-helix domain-containing protein [Prevotella sp. E2-28]
MKPSDLFYLNRHDRHILLVLLSVAVVAFGLMFLVDENEGEPTSSSPSSTSKTSKTSPARSTSHYYQQPSRRVERFAFDPNTADSTQLLRLGLQSWQVRNIYKYRAAGGIYRKKEDFAKLYGLTVKQYRELEPYIQISADYQPASTLVKEKQHVVYERDTLRYPVKIAEGEHIELNASDTSLYKKVPGVGSYYARKIAEYGRRLGGFVSANQLDEIENFPSDSKKYFSVNASGVHQLNVNRLSLNDLKRHPYINYYQAKAITDYRRLHGPLHSLNDLRLLPDFSAEAIKRLEPYVCF